MEGETSMNNSYTRKVVRRRKIRLFGSRFEDLPNEIIYEILDYLDHLKAYESFAFLNARFKQLLILSSIALKLHLSLTSEDTAKYRSRRIIAPNVHRIISLHLSDSITIDHFLSLVFIDSSFVKLERLILNGIKSDDLLLLLERLISLRCLYYLSAHIIEKRDLSQREKISEAISDFPLLKRFKLTFELEPKEYDWLGSNGNYRHNVHLHFIASRHYGSPSRGSKISKRGKGQLRLCGCEDLTLEMHGIIFEAFVKSVIDCSIGGTVKTLCVIANHESCLNANLWEELIVSHMPQLIKFHLKVRISPKNDMDIYHEAMEKFQSPFWLKRDWTFDHQHRTNNRVSQLIFFTVKSRR